MLSPRKMRESLGRLLMIVTLCSCCSPLQWYDCPVLSQHGRAPITPPVCLEKNDNDEEGDTLISGEAWSHFAAEKQLLRFQAPLIGC